MTISVNITRQTDSKDYDLQIIRRSVAPQDNVSTEEHLETLKPGETAFAVTLWNGKEIVLREK